MSKSRILSFKYAGQGIIIALRDEPNLKVHFLIAILVTLLGNYLHITQTEWLVLILVMGLVIALELTNTAIEEVVNVFAPDLHPSAKKAKDVAAGAVLVASVTATVIGIIIFLPYLYSLILI